VLASHLLHIDSSVAQVVKMFKKLLIGIAVPFSVSKSCTKSEFYGKTAVVDLCEPHFPDKTSDNVWMVEFYAPWCGHCQALKPKFIDAAKKAKKESGIKFGAVDCTKEQYLCQKYGVQGYPTLKALINGRAKDYQGPRETEPMIDFIKDLRDSKGTKGGSSKCSSKLLDSSRKEIVPLCSSHFPDKKSKNSWVIVFITQQIEKKAQTDARKHLYAIGSTVVEGGAKMGIVDCPESGDFCASKLGKEEESSPFVVKTYTKGQTDVSKESFTDGIDEASRVIDFVKAQLGSKFKVAVANDEL
jgi:protein disulfide-isomerase-like protein